MDSLDISSEQIERNNRNEPLSYDLRPDEFEDPNDIESVDIENDTVSIHLSLEADLNNDTEVESFE